jgi:DUF971 family protein
MASGPIVSPVMMSERGAASRLRAAEVRHLREPGAVRITWSDGHVGEYPYAYLRGWCPCASCQGHGGDRRFLSFPDARLSDIHAVGNYAIGLRWHDGHDTGIYAYTYLRELCPCSGCAGGGGRHSVAGRAGTTD